MYTELQKLIEGNPLYHVKLPLSQFQGFPAQNFDQSKAWAFYPDPILLLFEGPNKSKLGAQGRKQL
ncbi:unnamed protein product [Brassica oleracea var. botrytis]|uniref:Uncharacterized protein n=2 Tax=Brassica oleracea TaxID=3712 RepID=A0A0D3ALV4_BRAOL|nr:unnamed protein product [Brassica oleracea]